MIWTPPTIPTRTRSKGLAKCSPNPGQREEGREWLPRTQQVHNNNNTIKLTSLTICKNPLTICFAKGNRSPQQKRPRVNSAFSFTFDGNFALPTILNNLSATVYFDTTSSISMASFLLMLNGLSVCRRESCFGEKLGSGKPLQRARRDTAEHDMLTSNAWESARKLAEKKV